ncbi:hypothetical protein SMSP2_02666 [Limihaloglobus sulfuriphilus]|uniref:Uncharacterized protein n=1 Tax=Limihaloglobus sulfuriphilus TaxID=1851148 RepID=A0A1R7T643_9BACT|nr:hypothetical protein SMSP2_02666 [Limihaloglobus sulfuriphilus]
MKFGEGIKVSAFVVVVMKIWNLIILYHTVRVEQTPLEICSCCAKAAIEKKVIVFESLQN